MHNINGEGGLQTRPGNGLAQHQHDRVVMKNPPRYFFAETLPVKKIDSQFYYGIRVYPLLTDNQSCYSNSSISEYEIWRRWEDCLWFQEVIEYEYFVLARSKRTRLAAGKGIKKDGVYIHSDGAASFESLPPGPDANSVAADIHEIIPKLSKKGTFFRPSTSTVVQRGLEFKALIEGFFDPHVPALIHEVRDIRVVREFFGIWRLDREREAKAKKKAARPESTISISSSMLSPYLPRSVRPGSDTASNRSTSSLATGYPRTPATATSVWTTEDRAMSRTVTPRGAPPPRAQAAVPAPRWSVTSDSAVPVVFVSGEERIRARMTIDKNPSMHSLPEDGLLSDTLSQISFNIHDPSRDSQSTFGISSAGISYSNAGPDVPEAIARMSSMTMFTDPWSDNASCAPTIDVPRTSGPGSSSSESLSWRGSESSVTSIGSDRSSGDGSDVEKELPEVPDPPATSQFSTKTFLPRDSLASLDSFIAGSIMQSLLPRRPSTPDTPGSQRSFSAGDRSCRESLSLPWDEPGESTTIRESSILPAYKYEQTVLPLNVPRKKHFQGSPVSTPDRYPKPFQHRPPNQFHIPWNAQTPPIPEATSPVASEDSSVFPATFTIKAVKDDTILLLRADDKMRWSDLRNKIAEKFEAEGEPLTKSFLVGYVPSSDANAAATPASPQAKSRATQLRGRPRASSTSSVGLLSGRAIRTINSDQEWQALIAGCNGKLVLRILDRF
ncbi:hypothetical protein BXZ70DRAFT_1007939 [Cristinia sonorae]|uniref:PX domain-containing protein n=1 Tax=Cristinia sonorae TaxID=1940300 RepID=A0A8K0URH9_9AGAR|nr:hypothetical protein BXZ70DRAFT_1007939 [Cristinia sonorae]